ncbi:hypothetical protein ACWD48_06210 [Streptomyces sp. NPDC002519]
MQPQAPTLDVRLDPSVLEAGARRWADRTRQLAIHSTCEEQEAALRVVAFQLSTARNHLGRGDMGQAREALRIATNYACSEEANTPQLAGVAQLVQATSALLAGLPA